MLKLVKERRKLTVKFRDYKSEEIKNSNWQWMHSTLIKEVIWHPHFIFSEIIVQKNINLHDHFSFKVLSPFFNTYKQRQLVNTASVLSSVQGRMSEKDSHLGKCPTHENTLITSKTF